MEDFNPRSPIRLSDIDNLLQESIFESSDGAKLVEYLKKKRGGGGRVRLQNIFQQVPVQRAQFNFNLDSSEPTPLPESPQPTTSNGDNVIAAPVVVTTVSNGSSSGVSPRVPIVMVNDLNSAKKSTVKQIVLKSPGPMNTLSRQLLINQYQRTNAAKCELLKHLASSTPKPDTNGSIGRLSTFTTSISPITEGDRSPLTPIEEIPSSQPVAVAVEAPPMHVMEIVVPPPASQEVLVPCSQPILAPCSQAVPQDDGMPKKVVVLQTAVVNVEDVVIPETPSPVKVPSTDSPKAHPNHIQPRRLSTTFKQMENAEAFAYANGHLTSDESEGEEEEQDNGTGGNSVLLKSILKDTSMGGGRSRHSMRVSFSKQLVQQREISPAPDIPEADNYIDSNSSDDSDLSDSDDGDLNDYQVVDEVYTDDDGEDAANLEHYEELKSRICELNNSHNNRRSVSPLIDVVKETPVQWFETTTPTKRRDQQDAEEQQFPPPTTVKKDNKTNLQLVDIITDWDDEEDEEEADHSAGNPETEPSQECVPEPRASINSNNHETNLDTMDISSSNLEDSVERLVELPPDPNAMIEEEGVLPEEHIYPAAVDEQMPSLLPSSITTEELVDVLSGKEPDEPEPEMRSESPKAVEQQTVELPPTPPPATTGEEPQSPDRVITPPVQFTSSAKRRFIQQNEDDLITRLQNDLPLSQPSSSETENSSQTNKTFEKVSETLVEIAQSFRDQPSAPSQPTDTTARRVVQPPKRGKKSNVDPVTASYFEAIEKTFAKPMAPPTTQRKKTEQKRKLYDATLSEVTEDDESVRVAKPTAKAQQDPKLRALKVVIAKLNVDDYLPNKASSRPEEPDSEGTHPKPAVIQEAPLKAPPKSRRASKDKPPAQQTDSAKRPRGRPKKVRTESIAEPETERPVENGHVQDPSTDASRKKHKLKPNLFGDARQQRESLPNRASTEELDTHKDVAVEKKKRSKPSEAQHQLLDVSLPNGASEDPEIGKDKGAEQKKLSKPNEREEIQGKQKPKPNLTKASQKQQLDESMPNAESMEKLDTNKDEVVMRNKRSKSDEGEEIQEKKQKAKPNLVVDSQQHQLDESMPNDASMTDAELDARKDQDAAQKKRSKPNEREEIQKKQKPKPNLAEDSQQQQLDEVLANGAPTEDLDIGTYNGVEQKKRSKSNQREELKQQLPTETLPNVSLEKEHNIQKDQIPEKKKKPKPNVVGDSEQQRLDEVLPNGESAKELDARKDKAVEKNKRPKPNEREDVVEGSQQQRLDEVLPNEVSMTDVELDTRKDKVVEQKKQSKQNQQRPSDDIQNAQIPEKKRKPKPNIAKAKGPAEDSQQQLLDEGLAKEASTTNAELDNLKDKVVDPKKQSKHNQLRPSDDIQNAEIPEKKRKPKPNIAKAKGPAEDSQQQLLDEGLAKEASTTNAELDNLKDKVVDPKKQSKHNQLRPRDDIQKDQIPEKKKKPKPNIAKAKGPAEDSQQQLLGEGLAKETSTTNAELDTRKDKVVDPKKRSTQAQCEESNQQRPSDGSLAKEHNTDKDSGPEKKRKPKPNVVKDSQQSDPVNASQEQPLDEGLANEASKPNAELDTRKDMVEEQKKPSKPCDDRLAKEHNTQKEQIPEKKKKPKPNLSADSQKERLVESLPNGDSTTDKDKVVEKKKKSKPNQQEEHQQERTEESVTTINVESGVEVEQETRKKKKLKPNLAAVPKDIQQEQPPPEPLPTVVQQSSNEVVAKKKKLRPNFGTKSKQQHAEVAPVEVTEGGGKEQLAVSQAQPMPTGKDKEAVKEKKKHSRKSLDGKPAKEQQQQPTTVTESDVQPEIQLKQFKVLVTKLTVAPTTVAVSTSPASKVQVLQRQKSAAVKPSPATARKLFDEPDEPQAETDKVHAPKKARKKHRADEDTRNKRKEAHKQAKLKSTDPIPKVRISAEKDGLYRITTPGREVDPAQDSFVERLNVSESDNSATIRSSLEECQEEFLGFEDDQDTIADLTVDLSRSNMELIIPLEPLQIPKGVKIPRIPKNNRKPRQQPQSPAPKPKKLHEQKQPRRISVGTPSKLAQNVESPEKRAVGSQVDNRSLPLKKRKSRDSSQEYLPSAPEEEAVFAIPAPVNLNDSLLIPMLQRVPIADKYVVRSTPDRGTESTEYDTDDTCATGDNVLIVRKDTSRLDQSRLDQSRLSLDEECEVESEQNGLNVKKKLTNRRQSIPLPRFYGDNTFDITWKPRIKPSRKNKRRLDNDSGIEEEDGGVVRRSKRTCRISKQILMTNPLIKSAYDRPNYRPMSVEQLLEAEKHAKKLKQEEKVKRQRKPGTTTRIHKPSRSPRNRKRIQEPVEAQEGEQQAKRTRTDSVVELPEVQPPSTSSSSSGTASCAEVAVQCEEDHTVQRERQQAQTWMMKLMAENTGREEVMPQATSSGDRMHFTLDHLTFQERNGIQYSFFIYSETENFGFLRFAPAAVKKWTKTADFLLKFLVLHGQLSFQINGKETVTKGGDFLMLPQNTRYRIQNSDEISLVFMIKFRAASNELPSM